MELFFLGTGAGMPTRQRNVTSLVLDLLAENGAYWLFDCGEGTQQQILHSSVKLSKLNKLFITHLHGDHIYGLPGLLSSRSNQGGITPLIVYGPPGIQAFIDTALSVTGSHLMYPLEIVEISEGKVYVDDLFTVEAKLLEHRIESFGFRIVEHDRPGKLNVEKLRAIGIASGPVFGELKLGKTVLLTDGSVLYGSDFIGPALSGRKLAIMGDTRYCNAALELSYNVDVLVHEATFSTEHHELAQLYFHSTTVDAAKTAADANAKTLIMTHFSSRYQEDDLTLMLSEAKQIFANSYLAEDYMHYAIPLHTLQR
ncbi:MAG: rnz [Bacilli bacterium]|nr:rnz [Bacilli bacterium]